MSLTLQVLELILPMQWLKWETLAHLLDLVARLESIVERPTKNLGLMILYKYNMRLWVILDIVIIAVLEQNQWFHYCNNMYSISHQY